MIRKIWSPGIENTILDKNLPFDSGMPGEINHGRPNDALCELGRPLSAAKAPAEASAKFVSEFWKHDARHYATSPMPTVGLGGDGRRTIGSRRPTVWGGPGGQDR